MGRFIEGRLWPLLMALTLIGAACSGDPDPVVTDSGPDDLADVGHDDADPVDASLPDVDPVPGALPLCAPCSGNEQCGGPEDFCVQLFGEERFCGLACDPDGASCPNDYFCGQLGEGVFQCVPSQLTCTDLCAETTCSGNQICDPLSGECVVGLGLCETGCFVDGQCAGTGSRCLGSGSPDGEAFCATGCDASAQTRQCPVDYLCIAIDAERSTVEGVCYPIKGTCVDRCSEANCPEGQNCDPVSGACVTAAYGYCERGCASHAECGGQDDLCFDLGIGTGSHCWAECSRASCADGYNCVSLQGTTIAVCIPEVESCASCYDDSCFPDGVCHPDGGACMTLEPDCNEAGCTEGFICEPVSGQCVEPGKTCSGSSWATDCDNVVTRCTTRRANTTGTCTQVCLDSSECSGDDRCITTNLGRLCLAQDLGGSQACSTLYETANEVGRPCGTGSGSFCRSPATQCVQSGGIPGFCSMGCNADSECGTGAICAPGPSGANICLPAQCLCAGDTGLATAQAGLTRALTGAGLSLCGVILDTPLAQGLPELDGVPLQPEGFASALGLPLVFTGTQIKDLEPIHTTNDSPTRAIESAAGQASMNVIGVPASTIFTDDTLSKLTQALVELIEATGANADTGALELAAADVPESFQDVAAPIIRSVAAALVVRNGALASTGLTEADVAALFESAPYLFLAGTEAQEIFAPDLRDPLVLARLEDISIEALAQAAANIAATVEAMTANLEIATEAWANFSYVVDTPAGKVILGDTGNTLYDPIADPRLAGPVALLIDAGGDDTYLLDAGANTSPAAGVSLLLDLGGNDTYAYVEAPNILDGDDFLVSDAAGRRTPTEALNRGDGPLSLSSTARQGAGRLGIGMLIDLGDGDDTYRSLRMSQGASVFGVGLLFDGGGADIFEAEALSQGAAIGGLGVLWSAGGNDHFRLWHAGQGFGAGAGYGLLFNRDGDDTYEAVRGETNGAGVLYFSDVFAGRANRSFAQGAAAGIFASIESPGLSGGRGVLFDAAGADTYIASTFAQGYGTTYGLGILYDRSGDDTYASLGRAQGLGEWLGAGLLLDAGGEDSVNEGTLVLQYGQGAGLSMGWGVFALLEGNNRVNYMAPGGGVGLDGGMGLAITGPGDDAHIASSASWGFASRVARDPDPLAQAFTLGLFIDIGGADNTYERTDLTAIAKGLLWLQPDPSEPGLVGVGVDMP